MGICSAPSLFVSGRSFLGVRLLVFVLGGEPAAAPPPVSLRSRSRHPDIRNARQLLEPSRFSNRQNQGTSKPFRSVPGALQGAPERT